MRKKSLKISQENSIKTPLKSHVNPLFIRWLLKLLAVGLYELLILVAIWLAGTALFVGLWGDATQGVSHVLLQIFLWLLAGAYFVWSWHKSGQTLAAQAWKLKLVNAQNTPLTTQQACFRYALASASLLACGAGFIWILFDKDRLFLHDKILNTRFVQLV